MERRFVFRIDEDYDGKDIKALLCNHLRCSSNIISRLKKGEYIKLNGEHATVRKQLSAGDELVIIIPEEKNENILPNPDIGVSVLYEDEDILVVNKQACIATHPSVKHYDDTLANGVANYVKDKNFTFRAVNRLDRQTSGIVIIAKNMLSAHLLGEQIKTGKIKKVYYAVCEGIPRVKKGRISAPIARESESIIKRCVSEKGKESTTLYETIKEHNGMALVKAEPVTGRTHQIRVHLSHIGCPIYGDDMYGSVHAGERVRLHCKDIFFTHPITGADMHVECDFPEDFNIML